MNKCVEWKRNKRKKKTRERESKRKNLHSPFAYLHDKFERIFRSFIIGAKSRELKSSQYSPPTHTPVPLPSHPSPTTCFILSILSCILYYPEKHDIFLKREKALKQEHFVILFM